MDEEEEEEEEDEHAKTPQLSTLRHFLLWLL